MNQIEVDKKNQAVFKLVADIYRITATYNALQETTLTLFPIYHKNISLKLLKERLQLAGYVYTAQEIDDHIILTLNSKPTYKIPPFNIFLFFVTLLSIYVVPVLLRNYHPNYEFEHILNLTYQDLLQGDGIKFTIAMMSILFVHEMGHYIASRRRNLITSWPYFIPAPNFIGTFGAIIKTKSPFWNRRDLIEVGAAGPIAGWIVALGWTIYGISTAIVEPINTAMQSGYLGEPLIFKILSFLFISQNSEHFVVLANEALFAGWVGMLVTALNMLPIGQLDGGHIVYGLLKKKQHSIALLAMACLFLLGFQSPIWWMFGLMGVVFGIKHPPTLNDSIKLSRTAIIMGISSLIIMILSFTPTPFQ